MKERVEMQATNKCESDVNMIERLRKDKELNKTSTEKLMETKLKVDSVTRRRKGREAMRPETPSVKCPGV